MNYFDYEDEAGTTVGDVRSALSFFPDDFKLSISGKCCGCYMPFMDPLENYAKDGEVVLVFSNEHPSNCTCNWCEWSRDNEPINFDEWMEKYGKGMKT